MVNWILIFISQLVWVGLRSFQQRNVAFDNYTAVMPTSCAMAIVEVYIIASIAKSGWHVPLVLAMALGGGIGCLLAMYIHKKWLPRKTSTSLSSNT